jgi:mycothiol system anti-sigma-R factor
MNKLERYVDRELTPAEVVEVRRHLEECPPCDERFRFESGVQRLVKVCCGQETAPVELREKLREILF